MKIALASQFSNEKIEDNFELIMRIMGKFKGQVDLICFKEAFLHGFDALDWDYQKDKSITICLESKYLTDIKTAAKDHEISVSFGFYEVFEDNCIVRSDRATCFHHWVSFTFFEL